MNKWKFRAVPHFDNWIPKGTSPDGKREIWTTGTCVQNKQLAQLIALGMEIAFIEGWKAAVGQINKINNELELPVERGTWQE